jgi:hypothetical protein
MSHERQVRAALWTLVGVGVASLLLLQIITSLLAYEGVKEIRATQQDGSPTSQRLINITTDVQSIARDTSATIKQLDDCLTPGGKCYQQSRRRTADVSALLLVGVACASGYQDMNDQARIEATNRCVARWLSQHPSLSSQ